MQGNKTIKACNFFVSEWHLFAALLPYLKDELKKNNKIIFISQDKLENKLKELTQKISVKFENKNGIDDITWIDGDTILNLNSEYEKTSIIIQGTYDYIETINNLLSQGLKKVFKECLIINCYDVFDTNNMLHEILEKHDYIFNTGGLHKKEEIFPDYKSDQKVARIL